MGLALEKIEKSNKIFSLMLLTIISLILRDRISTELKFDNWNRTTNVYPLMCETIDIIATSIEYYFSFHNVQYAMYVVA